MNQPVLSCRDLVVRVGRRDLIRSVNLAVESGERHVISGRSGSGKSTLLWTLVGLLPAGKGSIELCGEPVVARRVAAAASLRRRHVGIVYQQPNLLDELSVVENVAIPLMLGGSIPRDEAERRARELLEFLGIDVNTPVIALSGGEQQRVAVARALVGRPSLVVADEPTASLDPESAGVVLDSLESACTLQGAALLMASHDPMARGRAQQAWRIEDVSLVRDPDPAFQGLDSPARPLF